MKKVMLALAFLLLIAGIGVWYFVSFRMDGMIEQRIETIGAASLGTRVSVGTVKTDIRGGSLEISNITVANPPGFRNATAFSLNKIEAAVDYATLDIRRVVIDRPEIIIEEVGGETNFSRMLRELESAPSDPADSGQAEPVIVVRHFRMNESRAAFESESLDRYTDVAVDAVELTDLRGTPTEVARVIAAEVLNEVASDAAMELLKAQAARKYEDVERKVGDKLKDLLGGDDPGGG